MLMVIIILHSVWSLLQESAVKLLRTHFSHIQKDAMQKRLLDTVDGILDVHEFHVWQFDDDKQMATVHIMYVFLVKK